MRLFLCGQKSFGAAVLKRLLADGHEVVGVAAPPQEQYFDKIKIAAIKAGIQLIIDSDRLRSADIPAGTDLIVAAHSHQFISAKTLARARLGGIGFHPSALPRHRGRDAVRWAVAMGDSITGGSVYWLSDVVDGGDLQARQFVFIGRGWDYHRLWRELFPLGVAMLSDAVKDIAEGKINRIPQSAKNATWEPAYDEHKRLFRPELLQLG
jgi:methionyl-tRNA formyltransferase